MTRGAVSSRSESAPTTPEWVLRSFVSAVGAGQLDTAAACLAREACLITPDATAVRGRDSIRPLLAQLILARTEITIELSSVLIVTDTALFRGQWTIRSSGVDGSAFERVTNPFLLARWIETEWKLQIVAPWG